MVDDSELMCRVAKGDQQAFTSLLNRHSKLVLNVAYRIVLSRDDAEDLCQEVFERLWVHAPEWRDDAKLTTWLYRVANNLAINFRQRVQQRYVLDEVLVTTETDAKIAGENADLELAMQEHSYLSDITDRALIQALGSLPVNYRALLAFRFYRDLPVKEIAEIMGLSAKAVESQLGRAKAQLKQNLGGGA
ncbi:RNA polymerase sigma factor [Zhongshania borealis]|uniref:Sigma-70 family RNA polymerase sigma factor n=1 Tax=Zhongshania borealis TaxID=889488 RepID=A0ABP7W6H4_9GAMM